MASGRNHDRAITITTPIMLAAAIASGYADAGLIATASYYLAGMYLSPDLDLVSRPYKRWARDRFDSSVSLPGSFGQSILAPLPRSSTSPVVWGYRAECYGIFLWSRAECVESPATGWVINSTT
jgi:hypothetical protein